MQQLFPTTKKFDPLKDTIVFNGPGKGEISIGRPKRLGISSKKVYQIRKHWYGEVICRASNVLTSISRASKDPKTQQCRHHTTIVTDWSRLMPRGRSPMGGDWIKGMGKRRFGNLVLVATLMVEIATELLTHEPCMSDPFQSLRAVDGMKFDARPIKHPICKRPS